MKKKVKISNKKVFSGLLLEAAIKFYEHEDKRRLRKLKELEKLLGGKRR